MQLPVHGERAVCVSEYGVERLPGVEPSHSEASDALLDRVIMLRFPDFGWCKGTIVEMNVNRRRAIRADAVNFISKFDIDDE